MAEFMAMGVNRDSIHAFPKRDSRVSVCFVKEMVKQTDKYRDFIGWLAN